MAHIDRNAYNAYQRVYQLNRYYARMSEACILLGGQCFNCGSFENLEIDHVDWAKKNISINKLWSISKQRFYKELEKCQLLCDGCHLEKTREDISEIRTLAESQRSHAP